MHFRSDNTEGQKSDNKETLQVQITDIKDQWKRLWRNRIDDKVRAEGIADKDFSLLFVDRGTVIMATKDYKPLDFKEVLHMHGLHNADRFVSPLPSVGGYGKFARTVLNKQKRARKWTATNSVIKQKSKKTLPKKKGGRGWLHYSVTK